METASEKQHAHELIERLPAAQVSAVVRFLELMLLDPVARAAATAPPDDEPATEQDRTRYQAGQVWLAQRGGKGIPIGDVMAEFGLKPEDFPQSNDKTQ
jgi:hypothetical protein